MCARVRNSSRVRLVGEQVELAVAIARARVAETVALVGRWAQRLGEQRALVHAERRLSALGHIQVTPCFHDVADVEVEDVLVGLLPKRVVVDVQLDLPAEVAQVEECRLAVSAS